MNYFGSEFRHTIVALDNSITASKLVSERVPVSYADCPKTSNPAAMITRLATLISREKPNLVLTYNWGSIDAVTASLLCRIPVVHTEDGFNDDEAIQQKPRRILARRLILRLAKRVVAPSRKLTDIMHQVWRLPATKVQHIPNGIDIEHFRPRPGDYQRLYSHPDEVVIGTVGHLRPEKRQGDLIQACARLAGLIPFRLLVVGDGSEREKLEIIAREAGIQNQVTFLGHRHDVDRLYWEFDAFALSSATEQMPLSVLEAMASGLPVLSTAVGDIPNMVSPINRSLVVADLDSFSSELDRLARDPSMRVRIGVANRAYCKQHFSCKRMSEQYRQLYYSAAGLRAREGSGANA